MQKGFVFVLILAILIGLFAISNSSVVAIDFIFTEVMLSQAIVIFICVLLGAIIASIFGWIRQMSLKKEIKQLKLEKDKIQVNLDKLTQNLVSKEEEIKKLTLKKESKEEKENIVKSDDFSNNK